MTQVVWSPQAEQDLVTIYARIYLHNPLAAERVVVSIEQKVKIISRHPKIGVGRPDLRPGARMLAVPPHVALYIVMGNDEEQEVHLLRILDGRRNLEELL